MNPGDILLFKSEGGISRLISWGTGSRYTHVAVCVSCDMHLAIEAATRGGVRARDVRRINTPYDIYRIKAGYPYDLNKAISCLVENLNKKYDFFGVIFLGLLKLLALILRRPLKNAANKWQKNNDYFCSELCYEAFFAGGLDIVPDVPEADVTSPGDISKSNIIEFVEGS